VCRAATPNGAAPRDPGSCNSRSRRAAGVFSSCRRPTCSGARSQGSNPWQTCDHARLLVLLADGMTITEAAATVGLSRRHTYKWIQRFMQEGLEGLVDTPGRGHRRVPRQHPLSEPDDMVG